MKNLIPSVALCIFICSIGLPLRPESKGQSGDHAEDTYKQNSVPQQQMVTVNCPNGNESHKESQEKDAVAENPQHDYVAWGFWFNVVLTPITLLVAGAAIYQAIAAKSSADAVMRSERAWLLLNGKDLGMPVLIPTDSLDNPIRPPVHCHVSLENCGNTPAFAVDWEFELRIGPSQDTPPSLEIYEKKRPMESPTPFPIGPGWPGHAEAWLKPRKYINTVEKNQIDTGAQFLWLCGIARYEDVFKPEGRLRQSVKKLFRVKNKVHETRICLRYETRMDSPQPYWVLGGARKYNHAT